MDGNLLDCNHFIIHTTLIFFILLHYQYSLLKSQLLIHFQPQSVLSLIYITIEMTLIKEEVFSFY